METKKLYCAQDAAVTFDLFEKTKELHFENTLSQEYEKFITQSLTYMNQVILNKDLIREWLSSNKEPRLQYSKLLREKNILKQDEIWKLYKLENFEHTLKKPEEKQFVKKLLKNKEMDEKRTILQSLLNIKRFAFFVNEFEPLLRSSNLETQKLSINSLDQIKEFVPNSRLWQTSFKSLLKAWKISDTLEQPFDIVKYWLYGYSPIQISRKTNFSSKEIKEIMISLNEKNLERVEMIEKIYYDVTSKDSLIRNPLTNNQFHVTSSIEETHLISLLNNEFTSLSVLKKANSLEQPFLINKNKLLIIKN